MKRAHVHGKTGVHQHLIGSMKNFVYAIVDGGESFIMDPQRDLRPWEETLAEQGAKLKGVLLTHTHHDHVAGLDAIAEKYGVPIYVHPADAQRLALKSKAAQAKIAPIEEGTALSLGKAVLHVLHTPGHSAGEVCYLLKKENPWALFTGDTIFVGTFGRTDLDTGSSEQMLRTIARIKALPADTVIFPGHDYGSTWTTTVAREIAESPGFACKTVAELDAVP